jgi:hypothetical protein
MQEERKKQDPNVTVLISEGYLTIDELEDVWDSLSFDEKLRKISMLGEHRGEGIKRLIDIAKGRAIVPPDSPDQEVIERLKRLRVGEKAVLFVDAIKDTDLVNFVSVMREDGKTEFFLHFSGDRILVDPDKMVTALTIHLGGEIYTREVKRTVIDHFYGSSLPVNEERVDPYHLLPVKNGVLDLESLELRSYGTCEYYFTRRTNIEVDKDILAQINDGSYEIEKNMIYQLWRPHFDLENWSRFLSVCGTFLAPFPTKTIAYVVGETDAGKTSCINAVVKPIEEKIARISPYMLISYSFGKEDLLGRWANVYTENPARALKNVEVLNMLAGESEKYDVARKHREFWRYRALKTQLYGMNDIMPIKQWDAESIDAFANRLVMIDIKKPENFVIVRNIVDQVPALEGLYFMLYGRKVLENNNYEIVAKQSRDEIKEILYERTWMLRKFKEDCLADAIGSRVKDGEAYKVYLEWARENGITRPFSKRQFFDEMSRMYSRVAGHTKEKYFVNVEFTAYGKELLSKRGARQSKEESLDIK